MVNRALVSAALHFHFTTSVHLHFHSKPGVYYCLPLLLPWYRKGCVCVVEDEEGGGGQHTSGYTSAYVRIRVCMWWRMEEGGYRRASAYVCIRQHTPEYVSLDRGITFHSEKIRKQCRVSVGYSILRRAYTNHGVHISLHICELSLIHI